MLKDIAIGAKGLEGELWDHIAWLTGRAWRQRKHYYDAVVFKDDYGQGRHRAKYYEQRLQILWLRRLIARRVTA